jgi:spore germination protein YaaH
MTEHHRTTVRRRIVAGIAAFAAAATVTAVMPAPAGAATAPTPRRLVTGWGYFNSTSSPALTSLQANRDLFSDVSPFWHSATWNGSSAITSAYSKATRDAVLPAIRATGVAVLPSITDGMPARRMAAVLASPTTRTAFVNQIVSLVTTEGYDGIDLDFERFAFSDGRSTWPTTRPAWVAFVKQLYAALHAKNRMLSITTPPLYTPTTGYWVYDWAGIASYVDRLRVMTYDYSTASAGPIAPYAWVSSVAAFAVTQVPAGKVQIGVPSYGHDWRTGTTYAGVTGLCPTTAPAGSNPTQVAGFADSLATMASGRKTFTSSGAATYVATLTAPSFASPGVSYVTKPAVTWDATYKERTFATSVSFRGTRYQKVVTTGTAPIASATVTVASTTGLVNGLSVVGAGVAARTTVTSFNPTTKVVTLSQRTSAAFTATALTFSGNAPAACRITRLAYYEDASSAAARATLVATYHLRGIAEWTIGGEAAGQWPRLRSYATTIAPNPTLVGLSVPSSGTYRRPFAVNVSATSAGLPVAGGQVAFYWRRSGATTWTLLSIGATGPTGRVTFTPSISSAGTFRAVVPGTFDRLSGRADKAMTLRTAVTLTGPTSAVKPATGVVITAHFAPQQVGQPSKLQVLRRTGWVTLATRQANSAGRSAYAVRSPATGGVAKYRVFAGAYRGIVAGAGYITVRSA